MTTDLTTARKIVTIGAVIGIITGVLWCFTLIGILWGAINIYGGIKLLKLREASDAEFIAQQQFLLYWGIYYLFTTVICGLLLIVAFLIVRPLQ